MTSDAVRQAMTVDYGSRDKKFLSAVDNIRKSLIEIAAVDSTKWVCILQQGAGTMGIEASISTLTPRNHGKYLLLNSGKYAERQLAILKRLGRTVVEFRSGEGEEIQLTALEALMKEHPDITNVGYVHHETSTGMVYPAVDIAALARAHLPKATIIVDAISSFGGIPFAPEASCDLMITSSNKCFHGVPGFSIIIARRAVIEASKGNCTSLLFDLQRQLAGFDKNGQFLVTPPVHVLMGFQAALEEYRAEGGLPARQLQYRNKAAIVVPAMKAMGFDLFLVEDRPSFGNIVVCVHMPKHPKWNFKTFYTFLNDRGFVIYPGKASHAETFRFGLIGATTLDDMRAVMKCSREALASMGIANLKQVAPPTNSKL
jgi:2-aminoethylphosphonate aminotransferase